MGKLVLLLGLILSSQSFALTCDNEVANYFSELNENRGYIDHGISNQIYSVTEAEKNWKKEIYNLNESQSVGVYYGYSDYMSGYGVEAIVFDQNTCEILKLVEVYAE